MVTQVRSSTEVESGTHPSWWTRLGGRFRNLLGYANGWTQKPVVPPARPAVGIRAGSRCVKGGFRPTNEDRSYLDANRRLFLVADGVGGHRGGGEASKILMQSIPEDLAQVADWSELTPEAVQTIVAQAVENARQKMIARAQECPRFDRMASTLALAFIDRNVLHYTRIGDCRLYLVREGRIQPLTEDETFAQSLANAGVISQDELRKNPYRNVVLNCVGVCHGHDSLRLERCDLQAGDRILLASDGLTDALDDEAIMQVVNQHGHPQDVADSLVYEALRSGARDNVTVIVVKVI